VRSSKGKLRIFTESFVAQCKVARVVNSVFRFPYAVSDFHTGPAESTGGDDGKNRGRLDVNRGPCTTHINVAVGLSGWFPELPTL
jgi:hypothetical protein